MTLYIEKRGYGRHMLGWDARPPKHRGVVKTEDARQFRHPARLFNDFADIHSDMVGQPHPICQAKRWEHPAQDIAGSCHNVNMAQKSTLGRRLKALRKAHPGKPTHYDVAAAIGKSRPHYTKIENDQDPVGREALAALAAYFGVSMDYLETGADTTGTQVPDESFDREDKVAWLMLGSALGPVGRADIVRYVRESWGGPPTQTNKRTNQKK